MSSPRSEIECDPNKNGNDCPDLSSNDMQAAPIFIDSQAIALLDLPTECLINIFEYLPVTDLVRLFKSNFNWKICAIIEQNVIGRKYFKFSEIKDIYSVPEAFKLFGKYFRKMEVGTWDLQNDLPRLDKSNELLRLIGTYCSPNNLKEISLDLNYTFTYQITPMTAKILPIFQNVETLTLRGAHNDVVYRNLLLSFPNIISIKLYKLRITEPISSLTAFPNMQSMYFEHCTFELSAIENFLRSGNNIQSFKWNYSSVLDEYVNWIDHSKLIQLFADNLPNIEELCLKFAGIFNLSRIYLPITEFTKLKIVELQSFSVNWSDIHNILIDFARKNTIQSLAIHMPLRLKYYNDYVNEMDYNIFASFTGLRSLFIYGLLKHSHKFCLAVLLKLPNLSELCIQNLDLLTQEAILKIVEGLRDLNCLKLLGQVSNFNKLFYYKLIKLKRDILHSETKLEIYLKRGQRNQCIKNLGKLLYEENLISLMPLFN